MRPLVHPAFHAQRFASVVVEFAESAPVHEFRATTIGPASDVVDVADRCVAVGCGAPVAVPGADERLEESVKGAAPGVAADHNTVAGDQAAE